MKQNRVGFFAKNKVTVIAAAAILILLAVLLGSLFYPAYRAKKTLSRIAEKIEGENLTSVIFYDYAHAGESLQNGVTENRVTETEKITAIRSISVLCLSTAAYAESETSKAGFWYRCVSFRGEDGAISFYLREKGGTCQIGVTDASGTTAYWFDTDADSASRLAEYFS